MFEFLIDFEREFRGFSGFDTEILRFSKKQFQVRIEINLVKNGKYVGTRTICGRKSLFGNRLILTMEKVNFYRGFDFSLLGEGCFKALKSEMTYWRNFLKRPKYLGSVVRPVLNIDPNSVHWTFSV